MSQPQPKIPSELIKYLGKAFNAWHIALPLLESHSMLFPQVHTASLAPSISRALFSSDLAFFLSET